MSGFHRPFLTYGSASIEWYHRWVETGDTEIQIFPDQALGPLFVRRINIRDLDPGEVTGIGLDDIGVDSEEA